MTPGVDWFGKLQGDTRNIDVLGGFGAPYSATGRDKFA